LFKAHDPTCIPAQGSRHRAQILWNTRALRK